MNRRRRIGGKRMGMAGRTADRRGSVARKWREDSSLVYSVKDVSACEKGLLTHVRCIVLTFLVMV